jgi:MFS family permease
MRDEKIEKLLSLAGNEHRYQYFALTIFLFLWMNCNFMAVVLPYLEREPLVKYTDENNIVHVNQTLSNEICEKKYEILKRFDYSWVSEYDIECDKFNIGLIGVFTFIGNTMGSIVFSIITKYFTHKTILLTSSVGFSLSIFICTLIHSVDYFYCIFICLIFVGLFGNCLCYSSLVVCEEIVSSNKRSFFSSIINMGYGLCGVMYSLIFMYIQNWRYDFYILIGFSLFIGLLIWLFVYDSPRIYIDHKDIGTTKKILEGIASFNGLKKEYLEKIETEETKQLIKEIMEYDYENGFEMKEINSDENAGKKDELINTENESSKKSLKLTALSSLKYPSLRYKFLILCILWFGTRSTSNCIALSSKALPGNFYFNIIFLFIFESSAYYFSGILINIQSLGRRGTLWSQYSIITISFLLLSFLKISDTFELGLNYVTRFCAAAIELVFYTYTLEVYPTPVRSVNFGMNVTFGNIGSILAPLVYEYLPSWLFLFIFALFSVFHAILLIFLPETVGRPMIESIEELNEQ